MFKRVFNRSYATYRRFNNQVSYGNLLRDPKTLKWGMGLSALGGVFYVTHLEPAPISGRKRFLWVNESIERYMGKSTYNQIMAQYRGQILPQNDLLTVRVKKIFKRILSVSDVDASIKWEIYVINSNDPPNAFVIPGGKVFVFKSILPLLGNDDGLATILSHEFAHQLARHSGENLSKLPFYTLVNILLYTLTGSDVLNNLLVSSLLTMPLSREMEREADYIGLMLMSKACFNPQELSKVWQRFAEYEAKHGVSGVEFLSSHPSSKKRLVKMQEWLKELKLQRELGGCNDNISGWFNDFQQKTTGNSVFGIDTRGRGGENGGLW